MPTPLRALDSPASIFPLFLSEGTPVNRIPIMAKQVLDLYTLYRLVTEKGGLVEVINKKIWREITKGLNLPTSITSAAFTLRTQYMKYLYPYECDKRGLSSPGELQAAIDSNRREGRRQTFGTALFSYSPVGTPGGVLSSPKIPMPSLTISTHNCNQMSQVHGIKKEDSILSSAVPSRLAIPVTLTGHHLVAAQAAASQAVALEQLRGKLETGEPPEKKMALVAEEQQRLVQHALQQNLLAMASQFPVNIKINSRGDDRQEAALNLSTNGISSINMSIEINGVVYTDRRWHWDGRYLLNAHHSFPPHVILSLTPPPMIPIPTFGFIEFAIAPTSQKTLEEKFGIPHSHKGKGLPNKEQAHDLVALSTVPNLGARKEDRQMAWPRGG
ncbi:hypothetical protein JD844_008083 [Phrynosoma platyrhinos]|uniref:AT-rich interactive domain-containing protein 3 n=1 Tax=Phrynosoma platyrhinos TaxID=52577 RepID=A0ABQ7TEB6_PHRPL|nr:hypothetical protein JD844_008083 [Phrynosoma platyrhinos]